MFFKGFLFNFHVLVNLENDHNHSFSFSKEQFFTNKGFIAINQMA